MDADDAYDLEAAIKTLVSTFSDIHQVYLFGSRRFNTGSPRSDIDLLLVTKGRMKPKHLREFMIKHRQSTLDLFLVEEGRATSVANESYIERNSLEALVSALSAVELFDRDRGTSPALSKMKRFEVDRRVEHLMTLLPQGSEAREVAYMRKFFARARDQGLPDSPYIGASGAEAARVLIEVVRRLPQVAREVSPRGSARTGWTAQLRSEYDFQNLFWVAVKPWLPLLAREEVAIVYDGQKKRADFSLGGGRILVELKHVKDSNTKAAIVKTLSGLGDFYKSHANVAVLVYGILVDHGVILDEKRWEADYSFGGEGEPQISTVVVRNPPVLQDG